MVLFRIGLPINVSAKGLVPDILKNVEFSINLCMKNNQVKSLVNNNY